MPVIGHAFVGIVTAREFEPGGLRNRQPVAPLARALWMPALVGLSYLPDVVTELGTWLGIGYDSSQLLGHSILFGLLAGLLIGVGCARWSGGPPKLLSTITVGSIVLHDVLDLLQATDRAPFWPISERVINSGSLRLPDRLPDELLIFGLSYVLYEGWRFLSRRHSRAEGQHHSSALTWAGRSLMTTLLISAVAVQYVRDERFRHVALARDLLHAGRFAEALKAAEAASRWPAPAGPGRMDIVRGEAYEGLGDNARAEMFYQRAYRSDPDNFWAVADLAEYYASHGTAAERRHRSSPYVEELRRRFSGNPAFHRVMDRVDRALAKAP